MEQNEKPVAATTDLEKQNDEIADEIIEVLKKHHLTFNRAYRIIDRNLNGKLKEMAMRLDL